MSSKARQKEIFFLWSRSRADSFVVHSCPVSCLVTIEQQFNLLVFHREGKSLTLRAFIEVGLTNITLQATIEGN